MPSKSRRRSRPKLSQKKAAILRYVPHTTTDEHGNTLTLRFSPHPTTKATEKGLEKLKHRQILQSPLVAIKKIDPVQIVADSPNQCEFIATLTAHSVQLSFECAEGWACTAWNISGVALNLRDNMLAADPSDCRNEDIKLVPGMKSSILDWEEMTVMIRFVRIEVGAVAIAC